MPSKQTQQYYTGCNYNKAILFLIVVLTIIMLSIILTTPKLHAQGQKTSSIKLPKNFEYPNGITHAPDGTIFTGSVTKGDIISIKPDGTIKTVFKETDEAFAGTALRYDHRTNVLWVASPDFVGKKVDGKTVRRPHRIAAIDVSGGKVIWSSAIPDKGFANDIALDEKGGVYITDSFQDRVLHLEKPGADFKTVAKSPLMSPGDLGPAGIVKLSDNTLIIGLWRDGALLHIKLNKDGSSEVKPVKLERPVENPDGMALTSDGRLLLLEGGITSGNGKLLLIDLKQKSPHKIEVLLDKLDTPLNLSVHNDTVAITEGRVRHFIIKDDPNIKIPKSFRVIKFKLNKKISGKGKHSDIRKLAPLPAKFYPESIARDDAGNYYLGSATKSSILRVNPEKNKTEIFIKSGANGLMSVQGLHVDEASRRLYACTANLGVHKRPSKKSALTAFHLDTAKVAGRWEMPDDGFCNDITSVDGKYLLISDTKNPQILRFDPGAEGSLRSWAKSPLLGGAAFNGNGIAWSAADKALYLSTFSDGRLIRIHVNNDATAGKIADLILPRSLDGADAVRVLAANRIVIFENGLTSQGGGRITEATVEKNSVRLKVLHKASSQPTSGTITKNHIVFATSHFAHLFGKKKKSDPGNFYLQMLSLTGD